MLKIRHMIRSVIATAGLVAAVLAVSHVAAAAVSAQAPAQVSAADAAPFIGDWTLALQGDNGPATLELTVKVEKDKVVGEIKGGEMPLQAITDITRADKSLVLRYSFDYQGNAVATVLSLIPAEGDKTDVQIDFAGGAYLMSGTATTRKDKVK
jgi:hypothetical protein